MSSYEINQVLLSSILALIIGCYATISGWLMYRNPKRYMPIQNRLRSMLLKASQESFAVSNRRHGVARMMVGVLILLGGALQIIGLILM